jgi:hypothetical protein
MPATRQRYTVQQQRRRPAAPGEPVWVIDLAAAEAQRAMQPATPPATHHWVRWLGAVAGAVWAYDGISLLARVRH